MKTKIIRTTSENSDFIGLVKQLNAYLKIVDGDDHDFYNQFNHNSFLKNIVIFYIDDIPVGCGALKLFDKDTMEIKRMYVKLESRGLKIATKILNELENWAKELGYKKCVLETGTALEGADSFYRKNKYIQIENYAQYKDVKTSLCFEKVL